MEKFYRLFKRTTIAAAIIFLPIFNATLFAQQSLEGVARIKVSEALARQLEQKTFARTSTGEVATGVQSVDQLNRQFKVREFTRVFPHGGKNEARHRRHGLHLWYEVKMDKAIPVSSLIQSYRSDAGILLAEPVYEKALIGSGAEHFGPRYTNNNTSVSALNGPSNDPMLKNQWHYHNTGQTGGKPGADISLFDAWKIETGNKNIVIAVTDGAVQADHPDLAANMWVNASEIANNKIDDDNNGYIDDLHGFSFVSYSGDLTADDHGTHVAGTIAAVSNNGIGVAGVAGGSGTGDGVRLLSCAVFGDDNEPDGFAEAYVYSADNGAVISQNSWGYTMPGIFEQVVLEAIDYFIAEAGKDENGIQTGPMNGGLVIFSAGNYSDDSNFYPAFYEPVLAVASSTHKDIKAQYSNFGHWIDITAPGGETYETNDEGVISTLADSQYGSFMGTSMACPHVSGVAGLVLSKFSRQGMRPETLRERLLQSVDDIDPLNPSFTGKLGRGRLNAGLALRQGDQQAPQPVNDLAIANKDIGEITLTWTSPKDESDFTAMYELRYSTSPITEANFSSGVAAELFAPKPPGLAESFTVKGLAGGVRFFFAIRSIDFEGNVSAISNVVSEISSLAPSIVLSTVSITENLMTAGHSTRTFTIRNEGKGALQFAIQKPGDEKTFAAAAPMEGVVSPGKAQTITVTFDASELLTGVYHQDIIIENNDPEKNTVILPLTLKVQNNGSPIASVAPVILDFKSGQIGTTVRRTITITNGGSDLLAVTGITSSHNDFKADFSANMAVDPFKSRALAITFSPSETGWVSGEISIHTNDPANSILKVVVRGEGLIKSPVVISPQAFDETVEKGSSISRTLVLKNNGSQERSFRLEVMNNGMANSESGAYARGDSGSRQDSPNDSAIVRTQRMLERHRMKMADRSAEENALARTVQPTGGYSPPGNTRKSQASTTQTAQYKTGFENFSVADIGGQDGWFASQGWSVSQENPDRGLKHLHGSSHAFGIGERFALSPYLFEDNGSYPRYTTAAMRLNLDHARGTAWEVVPQDPWSYVATRIRFNADGTIEAMVIDNDYEFHWKKIPVATPSGYFDLAVEYNSWGSDTSGFPTYDLYINNQHVFSGTGLAAVIGQVAFVGAMETTGPIMDIDEFALSAGEYVPAFPKAEPVAGTVQAGQSVNISLEFDASTMKFGSYQSDLVIHIDETDSLIVPTNLTVTGLPSFTHDVYYVFMEVEKGETGAREISLTNTGGSEIDYEITLDSKLPGLTIAPRAGTIPVRGTEVVSIKFQGEPGLYENTIKINTNTGNIPAEIPLEIVVFDTGAEFTAPEEVEYEIVAGEIATRSLQIINDGKNTVSYKTEVVSNFQPWLSIDPEKATVSDKPLDVILTFDGRQLSPGTIRSWVTFKTNDIDHRSHRTYFTLKIVPDTVRAGKLFREVWTGIAGKEISSIPLNNPPDFTDSLAQFESPSNTRDNFGARIRGYIQAPSTGHYTFWIASNDNSELWLSTDEHEANKVKIASVSGYTNPRQWDKFQSQQSGSIYLEAHGKYYVEALHKEGVGTDHLAVGWQLPDETMERPVPALRLIPYGMEHTNEPPRVTLLTPEEGEVRSAPATIEIKAEAEDTDGNIAKVEFYNGPDKLGTDITAPYAFAWKNVPVGSYSLVAKATDNRGGSDSATVIVLVNEGQSCVAAGYIVREQWNALPGSLVSSIPLNTAPASTEILDVFESPSDIADNYGSRIRGFLCVPASGQYTFWIASNDKSELWLSTDANRANKVRIAHVSGYTGVRQWNRYATQQSEPVALIAGERYYVEALHKEGVGSDHLAVGWQLPDGTMERPVPGIRLLHFENAGNEPPVVMITAPGDGQTFPAGATVKISAKASDGDGDISKVVFYKGKEKLGEDNTAPYSHNWIGASGDYALTAVAIDNEGSATTSSVVHVTVESMCPASGTITRAYWTHVTGARVSDIPVGITPDGTEALTVFEGPVNAGINYGARIRGYLCPPATGTYYFWIASNDHSELWLSTNEDPGNKTRVAFVNGSSGQREWNKSPSQKSMGIRLTAGKTYYIEALHKQGVGSDHIAVGWQLPGGVMERPIAGSRLSPLRQEMQQNEREATRFSENTEAQGAGALQVYPNPVKGETLNIAMKSFSQTEGGTMEVIIRQINGVQAYSEIVDCSESCRIKINVADHLFRPGVYLLQIKTGGHSFIRKLFVP